MILPRKERKYLRSAKARKAFDWFAEIAESDNHQLRKLVADTCAVVENEHPDLNFWQQVAEARDRLAHREPLRIKTGKERIPPGSHSASKGTSLRSRQASRSASQDAEASPYINHCMVEDTRTTICGVGGLLRCRGCCSSPRSNR